MSTPAWILTITYAFCWVVFFILVLKTRNIGRPVKKVALFWLSLACLIVGTLVVIVGVSQQAI